MERGQDYNFVFQMPARPGDEETYFVVTAALQTRELIRRLLALTLMSGLEIPHRHEALCRDAAAMEQAKTTRWENPADVEIFSGVC